MTLDPSTTVQIPLQVVVLIVSGAVGWWVRDLGKKLTALQGNMDAGLDAAGADLKELGKEFGELREDFGELRDEFAYVRERMAAIEARTRTTTEIPIQNGLTKKWGRG